MNEYLGDCATVFLADNGIDLFDLYTSLSYRLEPSSPAFGEVNAVIEKMISFLYHYQGEAPREVPWG